MCTEQLADILHVHGTVLCNGHGSTTVTALLSDPPPAQCKPFCSEVQLLVDARSLQCCVRILSKAEVRAAHCLQATQQPSLRWNSRQTAGSSVFTMAEDQASFEGAQHPADEQIL